MENLLLNKREAAALARMSERNIDRIIRRDPTLPVTRIGARVLFPADGFREWIARHAVDRTAPGAKPDA